MRSTLLIIILLCSGCKSKERFSGIWLSLDDRSVHEWFELRGILNKHNAKATFFVTQPNSLTHEEVELLRILKNDGNEIGFHGNKHLLSENYIKKHGYRAYWKNEILAGLETMDSFGFKCSSFAYPYGAKYWFTDFLLLCKFDIVRTVAPLNKEKDLRKIEEIYYSFDGDKSVAAIGFDKNSGITKQMIAQAIDRAQYKKEILMLYAHAPSTENQNGYFFDVDILQFIIEYSKEKELKFCLSSDLK